MKKGSTVQNDRKRHLYLAASMSSLLNLSASGSQTW